ncbi:MAG: hypothetical protein K2L95_02870, partial [Alphaproteobacteria bacterium]|nr:hypothetical protein [Alphaproteobacteria bacterium]
AIQKSGNVHYLLDCVTAFAMTTVFNCLALHPLCHCEPGGTPPRGNPVNTHPTPINLIPLNIRV